MNEIELAQTLFGQGATCAQSVFTAFSEELGLDRDLALRISSGFGGGMARTGGTCGVVTGAVIALGLQHGGTEFQDKAQKERLYHLIQQFVEQFRLRHGGITCKDLLGVDLSTSEGFAQYQANPPDRGHCAVFVKSAAELLADFLVREA